MSAFLNSLHEEGTTAEILGWLTKLYAENLELRDVGGQVTLQIDPQASRTQLLNEVTRLWNENGALVKDRAFGDRGANPIGLAEIVAEDGSVRQGYYGSGEQPWDVAKRLGWAHHFAAVNALKYLRRTKEPERDLEKARWYHRELLALRGWGNYNPIEVEVVILALLRELTAAEVDRLTKVA